MFFLPRICVLSLGVKGLVCGGPACLRGKSELSAPVTVDLLLLQVNRLINFSTLLLRLLHLLVVLLAFGVPSSVSLLDGGGSSKLYRPGITPGPLELFGVGRMGGACFGGTGPLADVLGGPLLGPSGSTRLEDAMASDSVGAARDEAYVLGGASGLRCDDWACRDLTSLLLSAHSPGSMACGCLPCGCLPCGCLASIVCSVMMRVDRSSRLLVGRPRGGIGGAPTGSERELPS